MDGTESLNPHARRIAPALIAERPEFEEGLSILESGDFQASVQAPPGSNAGAIVVTTNQGDVWVHFSPPRMWYSVEDDIELLSVVNQLMSSSIVFVRIENEHGDWIETTLIPASDEPTLQQGHRATVLSWSGKFDTSL